MGNDVRRNGTGGFLIDTNDLLMAGDHTDLGRGRTLGIHDQTMRLDPIRAECRPQLIGMRVITGNTKETNARSQSG